MSFLKVSNCNVKLGGNIILDDINFEIKQGQHLAIIGPNGAGKSMLLRLMMHDDIYSIYNEKKEAVIEILDNDNWNIFELRQQIGLVSGKVENDLKDSYARNVFEAVASGSRGSYGFFFDEEVKQLTAEQKTNAEKYIKLMDIEHLCDRDLSTLSTGQLRRVMVARALSYNPKILFLDEPTAGLDMVSQRNFFESIRKIANEVTIVLITHHAEEIFPEISQMLLIKEAKIFRFGSKEEVLNSENMSELFGAKIKASKNAQGYYSLEIV